MMGKLIRRKGFEKTIGLGAFVTISFGCMVSPGLFLNMPFLYTNSGPSFLSAILVAGIVMFPLLMIYMELGSSFPIAGGCYTFSLLGISELVGFLIGFSYVTIMIASVATLLYYLVFFLGFFFESFTQGDHLTPVGITIALMILWITSVIHVVSQKWSKRICVIAFVLVTLSILAFSISSLPYFKVDHFVPFFRNHGKAAFDSLPLFFWVILGIEGVLIASEEIKLPSKVVPKGLLLSFLIIIIMLLIVSASYVGFLDRSAIHFPYVRMHELIRFSPPYKMVFGIIQHPVIQMMMLAGIISLSILAFVSAFFVTSRLMFSMGRDRFFFGSLGKLHRRFHTPSLAIIFLTAIVSIALIAVPEFVTLGLILAAPVLIIFATMALTVAILRKTHSETPRPFSIPCLKCFSIFVFVLATILIYWLGWPWTLGGGGFFLVVLPIYLLVHKRREPIMKSLWLIVYVLGLILLSYLGDPAYVYENFTSIKPLGIITYPSAFFVVGFFGIVIFLWGYYENIKIQKEESLLRDKSSAISDLN